MDLTMTVPVESFEPYRAELAQISRKLGVARFHTIDEPVAAALARRRPVVVRLAEGAPLVRRPLFPRVEGVVELRIVRPPRVTGEAP